MAYKDIHEERCVEGVYGGGEREQENSELEKVIEKINSWVDNIEKICQREGKWCEI